MRLACGSLVRWPRTSCRRAFLLEAPCHQYSSRYRQANCGSIDDRQTWVFASRRGISTLPGPSADRPSRGSVVPSQPHANLDHEFNRAEWEILLDDAFPFGIRTKEQLCFEADVGHQADIGSRLVDKLAWRQNIELWHVLLRAQALMNGHEGIKVIWKAAHHRGKAVRFDNKDPRVNALWSTFLSAGSVDAHFLSTLGKMSLRSNLDRPALFAEIVGAALEGNHPERASKLASWFVPPQSTRYRGREDLLGAFSAACQSETPGALKEFCKVYDVVPTTHIYTEVTSALWEQERPSDAFEVHSHLVSRGDLPPQFELLMPFVSHLAAHNKPLSSFLGPLNAAGASFDAQAHRLWDRERSRFTGLPTESLNIVASNTLGVKPKKLSDEFVARGFATRAFSFDFAVNSLRLIGLIEVGPLAVRQLALTAPDLPTLRSRFERLAELEIDTGSSAFVQTVKTVCNAGRWDMVQALVDNDLHHEVFEDQALLQRLLTEHCRTRDWPQINRTLTILCRGEMHDKARARSAALLFKSMLQTRDLNGALKAMETLRALGQGVSVNLPRLTGMILQRIGLIRLHRAHTQDSDLTAFLTGMLQDMISTGSSFPLKFWRGPLRALGQLGRMHELECLIYWIAEWYHPKGMYERAYNGISSQKSLNEFFGKTFQIFIILWCFRPRKGTRMVHPEQSMRWTRILKKLRDDYNVPVRERTVRWIFIRRLRLIFGTEMRLKHRSWIQRYNTVTLDRYWKMYDKMWDAIPKDKVKYSDRMEIVLHGGTRRIGRRRRGITFRSPGQEGAPQRLSNDIVMYRDIFNASWEDYQKQ
ncbi:hypothetical protein LTS07_005316 [Exophiala sideris]|uniref:Pentatricopeptide repeat domain-containing protein n=1 Tax=Exophiala sideris TaxID=1016849 RepID=A0ABR0JAY2_9EURO|nr:hypothetical protein LTS07_005316 [Exophiala sideris]KAK5038586.1 hypothetical protein LTR13_004333 [Exophiala sideris]KAK5060467.1 hypothetical protein LTR69_005784 [Exophiala sideris]KAK5183379.1 hypothetical protein LTR44_004380 [Eurotiomycetes sp. CCFEE 6388]